LASILFCVWSLLQEATEYNPDIHTYLVTCMAPLFGQHFTMLSVQWRHQSIQATPACVCDAIRQLFLHQPVVFMTRTRLLSLETRSSSSCLLVIRNRLVHSCVKNAQFQTRFAKKAALFNGLYRQ